MTVNPLSAIPAALMLVVALLAGCGDGTAAGAAQTQARSQQREVFLAVPDMSCPMCPVTVGKALAGVAGVTEAEASLEDKQARVVFDPAQTDIEELIAAVAEAGFTAMPQDKRHE